MTGNVQARMATVLFLDVTLLKSIQPNCPKISEKSLVQYASVANTLEKKYKKSANEIENLYSITEGFGIDICKPGNQRHTFRNIF